MGFGRAKFTLSYKNGICAIMDEMEEDAGFPGSES